MCLLLLAVVVVVVVVPPPAPSPNHCSRLPTPPPAPRSEFIVLFTSSFVLARPRLYSYFLFTTQPANFSSNLAYSQIDLAVILSFSSFWVIRRLRQLSACVCGTGLLFIARQRFSLLKGLVALKKCCIIITLCYYYCATHTNTNLLEECVITVDDRWRMRWK